MSSVPAYVKFSIAENGIQDANSYKTEESDSAW